MRNLFFTILLSLVYLLVNAQPDGLFYYVFDNKKNLNPVTNKYSVEFIGTADESVFEANNFCYTRLSAKLYEVEGDAGAIGDAGQGIYNHNQLYTTDSGVTIHIKNSVILQWKEGVSESQRNALISQHGLEETKSTRLYTVYKTGNALAVSQMIHETGLTRYCHPEFTAPVEKAQYIPNDEYFGHQFYLHNTGQECNDGKFGTVDADIDAPEAWEITTGSSDVVIAIVDEGVTDDHPDLPGTRQLRLPGSNIAAFLDGSDPDDPSPADSTHENHGNACAGIAAAEMDNNEGVAGIAPGCTIMPVRVRFGWDLEMTYFADAITFAVDNGANIISCSWGVAWVDPDFDASILAAIEDAIEHGVIVICGAGNTSDHFSNGTGFVIFPANTDLREVITVAASDRNDEQANYSPDGREIEICAPSHTAYNSQIEGEAWNIWTIDIPGDYGKNPCQSEGADPLPALGEVLPGYGTSNLSYTGRMGGTSASTPMIAGVVALMLSVNPCLSMGQVHDILYNTAEKIGDYNYHWNSWRPLHSKETGYGRVNAFRAVQAAQQVMVEGVDLYTKDVPADFGIEPDEAAELLWVSEDIWVRNQPDGYDEDEHENPEYSPADPVYVYVRVRNNGCEPTLGTEELNLYWAKAATSLAWPDYWNGSITSPALMGEEVGVQPVGMIEAGGQAILEFEWYPPNPADYESINNEPWHFCLLTRITASNDPMNNELWTGTWNLAPNVRNNNNIAWKNLSVVDVVPGTAGGGWHDDKLVGATVAIGNASNEPGVFNFEFRVPENHAGDPVTKSAEVRITMDGESWQKWTAGGCQGTNVRISREDRRQLIVEDSEARLENMAFQPHERSQVHLSFNFLAKEPPPQTGFDYHVIQTLASTGEILGGEQYHIRVSSRESFAADAGQDREVSNDETVDLVASEIGEDAIYNWYAPTGDLVHTGKEITVAPEMTCKYKLEVIAASDGFKDYDEVEVRVKLAEIENISPNPSSNMVTIRYDVEDAGSACLMLCMPYSNSTDNFILDVTGKVKTIDVSGYQAGVYSLLLVVDGEVVDHKGLVIE